MRSRNTAFSSNFPRSLEKQWETARSRPLSTAYTFRGLRFLSPAENECLLKKKSRYGSSRYLENRSIESSETRPPSARLVLFSVTGPGDDAMNVVATASGFSISRTPYLRATSWLIMSLYICCTIRSLRSGSGVRTTAGNVDCEMYSAERLCILPASESVSSGSC